MLTIVVPEGEFFNEITQEFVYTKEQKLVLEHSLVSVSKWEAKWKKPFLDNNDKTPEETLDYIRCMTITKGVDPTIYTNLTQDVVNRVNRYIEDKMTATTFVEHSKQPPGREKITSELIYYWMIDFGIPVEFEKWHLNRLLTLIKVCSIKAQGNGKKMSKREILTQNKELNELRRKKLGSKG